jgi:hypothetical protein
LHVVKHTVFQELWDLGLEQVQAESVDGPDVHLGHTEDRTNDLGHSRDDAVFEFGRRLFGKGKGHDITGSKPI